MVAHEAPGSNSNHHSGGYHHLLTFCFLALPALLPPLSGDIGVNEAATLLLLGQKRVPAAITQPIAVLRRLITLQSMVSLATGIGVLPFHAGEPGRRNYLP